MCRLICCKFGVLFVAKAMNTKELVTVSFLVLFTLLVYTIGQRSGLLPVGVKEAEFDLSPAGLNLSVLASPMESQNFGRMKNEPDLESVATKQKELIVNGFDQNLASLEDHHKKRQENVDHNNAVKNINPEDNNLNLKYTSNNHVSVKPEELHPEQLQNTELKLIMKSEVLQEKPSKVPSWSEITDDIASSLRQQEATPAENGHLLVLKEKKKPGHNKSKG